MKEIQVDYAGGLSLSTRNFRFIDDGLADVAYKKIRDAMAYHREYGNDKDATIEIDFGLGKASLKISGLCNVVVMAFGSDEDIEASVEYARQNKKLMDRLDAEGLAYAFFGKDKEK